MLRENNKKRSNNDKLKLPGLEELKNKPIDEIFKIYNTSEKGLTQKEAEERLKIYGYNEIPEKKVHPLIKFLSYFYRPIPLMIISAALISLIIKDIADFFIILTLVILNGVIAFLEEHSAENAVEELKKRLVIKSLVLRNQKFTELEAKYLVPGDIIKIELGNIIPADGILISDIQLSLDESALTGESMPVKKNRGDIIYAGSEVKSGKGLMLVTHTADNTFFGKSIKLVSNVREQSDYQKQLIKIGSYLIKLAIIMIIITFTYGLFAKHDSFLRLLRFSLALLISSIPAALPTVLTLTMVFSAKRLIKKHALVKKFISLEELAGVDIFCSDKTGTLTESYIDIEKIQPYNNFKEEDVIKFAALASDLESEDFIDTIISKHISTKIKAKLKLYKKIRYIPFDPSKKYSECEVLLKHRKLRVIKGAPQVIANMLNVSEKDYLLKQNKILSNKGYKLLAVAIKDADNNKKQAKLVGYLTLINPPRKDAKSLVEKIKAMGVKIKIVSGDNLETVKTISEKLKIGKFVVKFKEWIQTIKNLKQNIEKVDGFAEVFPEDKYEIVKAYQENGHKVAMMGDGFNDAPALKKANIGFAVINATDAVKNAADIILTKKGLNVIYDALIESRKMFNRMKSYVIYRLTETIRLLFFITLSILFFNFYPLDTVMLLLLTFLNDIAIIAIATDNVKISSKPQKWELKKILGVSTILGVVGVISSFLLYFILMIHNIPHELIRTIMFLKLIIAGHLTLFVTRTKGPFYEIAPSKALLTASLSTISLAIIFSYFGIFVTKIPISYILFIIIYAVLWVPINDNIKLFIYHIYNKKELNKQ